MTDSQEEGDQGFQISQVGAQQTLSGRLRAIHKANCAYNVCTAFSANKLAAFACRSRLGNEAVIQGACNLPCK
jgi:hypothetical protein